MTNRGRQRGGFVFMALIVLAVIMVAAVGLIRSVGSGVFLSGNLAFRQAATYGADAGIEAARNWLVARAGSTGSDVVPAYFSSTAVAFNPGTFNWAGALPVNGGAADAAGNVVSYIMHRLCSQPGLLAAVNDTGTGQRCANGDAIGSTGSTATAMQYGNGQLSAGVARYFLVTVRVVGPRSTVSFVQATISLSDAELL